LSTQQRAGVAPTRRQDRQEEAMQQSVPISAAASPPQSYPAAEPWWPKGWWKIMDTRIGIVPVPIFVILFLLLIALTYTGDVKGEISIMIAVLVIGGFTCAEIGKRIPILRSIGAGAIFATFIPSALAYYKLLPPQVEKSVIEFTKYTNFLYLFIACIIVGSILGMDRRVLLKGFVKIFVPLAVGSLAAAVVGTAVGVLMGLGAHHSFFFVVLPIMAGGVGEGAIPLSIGYSEILNQPQGDVFAQILPPIMLGSLTAIILSGTLNFVGKRYPSLTGEGRLQPDEHDDLSMIGSDHDGEDEGRVDVSTVAAAGLAAITLYLLGVMCHRLFGLPAPVAMLFLAVLAKLTSAVSPQLEQGGKVVYKFFSTAVTYPLLFAIGVSLTPWDKLVAAFNVPNLITIVSTVVTLMATGAVVGRFLNMYPIESAIINACHSGQGGTGDVAILTAANRMQLMPFAQIATRIGGAITVTLVLIVLSRMS
jgi:CCS family citrate carrier protein